MLGPLKIFYCYAREDGDYRAKLDKHLAPLKDLNKIATWYDQEISPGKDHEEEILFRLNTSDIVLALVSSNFVASNYCQKEIHRALERHVIGDTRVIPVILKETIWRETPLGKLQVLPENGKPLVTWRHESGFVNIVEGIKRVIEEIGKGNRNIIDPKSADQYLIKAFALEDMGFYQEAEIAYKQAVRLHPDNFDAWRYLLDILFFHLKKYNDALIVCKRLTYLSARYQGILKIDNKGRALSKIKEYRYIYEKKVEIMKELNLLEEMEAAIEDLEHIRRDGNRIFKQWEREIHDNG